MIKFFRKIRQKLLSENQFSKYIIYAFGEIVLVVIGILIALQINNWNEERKNDILEQEYYCRLLEDVIQDKEQVNVLLEASKIRLIASNKALKLLQEESPLKKDVGIQISLSIRSIYSDFTPNNSAFEDLKSGANLNIIKDKKIIKALNNYFNKVKELSSIVIVNAENALDIYFSHDDLFDNGRIHALSSSNRFKGMDKEVFDAIPISDNDLLQEEMRIRLYNESFSYISVNDRHVELYNLIKDEIDILYQLLATKCNLDTQ